MPPWEIVHDLVVNTSLPAAGVAALAYALVRGALGNNAAVAAAAVAILAGFAEGNAIQERLPWWPKTTPWTWTLPALGVAVLAEAAVGAFAFAWLGRLAASGLVAWLLAPAGWGVVLFGLGVFACWQLLAVQLRDLPPGLGPLLLAVVLAGAAATVLIHSHTLRFTEVAILLASGLVGVAAASLLARDDGRGVAGPTAVLLHAVLYAGWTTTDSKVPDAAFFLVALAPLATGLAFLPALRPAGPWRRGAVLAALLAVPVVVAVVLAGLYESVDFE